MSAAGRRRIAAAQRQCWVELKKAAGAPAKARPKVKRKMSAAGRKRIAEATRKRWELPGREGRHGPVAAANASELHSAGLWEVGAKLSFNDAHKTRKAARDAYWLSRCH